MKNFNNLSIIIFLIINTRKCIETNFVRNFYNKNNYVNNLNHF